MAKKRTQITIIGAGPAGLGCAWELVNEKHSDDFKITLLEKNQRVGGLARTVRRQGYLFDIGPHRFYTRNRKIKAFWQNLLKNDFLKVNRLTRICYRNKFFKYPIQFADVLSKLGWQDSFKSALSYLIAKVFWFQKTPQNFEEWYVKNFGRELYSHFFKTYSEKLWGLSCRQISVDWAKQRIKNLDFLEALKAAFFARKNQKAKTLINKFNYPLKGSGQIYEKMAQKIEKRGAKILLNSQVIDVYHRQGRIVSLDYLNQGQKKSLKLDYLFSSMPITHFVSALKPKPPKKVILTAQKLKYRDHLTVNLLAKKRKLFKDNWLYIHSPRIKALRIVNYARFSPKMGLKNDFSPIAVEYFTFKNDTLWNFKDDEIINLAKKELVALNLLSPGDFKNRFGFVIRETEAYPVYRLGYQKPLSLVKKYLLSFKNFQLIGRGGMFKYNNMDHALYSGFLAARNYLYQEKNDLWKINQDAEYLESASKKVGEG